jgi:hypothetical protein
MQKRAAMKITKGNNADKRWSKNWSSRGTTMVNAIERIKVKPDVIQRRLICQKTPLSKQLSELLSIDPKNEFYQSLKGTMKKSCLTEKQVKCVVENYYQRILQRRNQRGH